VSKRRAKAVALLSTVAVLSVALGVGLLSWNLLSNGDQPKAAIVDQLSLTFPNPTFVETATDILQHSGYAVAYYPGEEVTVNFYRTLPSRGYDLILLRVHSTARITGSGAGLADVSLFTSEPYSPGRYVEQMTGGLGAATFFDGGEQYFGLTADFVRSSIRGGFDGATIVMMGCEGLISRRTAQAFVDRGASAFVSWSQPVSASHTDAATERLLELLLLEGLTPEDAVSRTAAEVGPDPSHGAELRILTDGG